METLQQQCQTLTSKHVREVTCNIGNAEGVCKPLSSFQMFVPNLQLVQQFRYFRLQLFLGHLSEYDGCQDVLRVQFLFIFMDSSQYRRVILLERRTLTFVWRM